MGFSADEQCVLLNGYAIDHKDVLECATTHDVVLTLVHVSALLHTWSAPFEIARDFIRHEQFVVPVDGLSDPADRRDNGIKVEFTTIADALLSRNLFRFEDAPSWVNEPYLDFHIVRWRGESSMKPGV